jgi:uncharacterized protein
MDDKSKNIAIFEESLMTTNMKAVSNIDTSVFIGHWPFHRIPGSQAQEVLESLDDSNTELALITPLNSVFYKDPNEGFEELLEVIAGFKKAGKIKFTLVINPALPYWRNDYNNYLGMKNVAGIRLFPGYHGYALSDKACIDLAEAAATDGMPVFLNIKLQDARIRHSLDISEDVTLDDAVELARKCTNTKICLSQVKSWDLLEMVEVFNDCKNLHFDTAMCVADDFVEQIAENTLIDRTIYGSSRPFMNAASTLEPLVRASVAEEMIEKICKSNAVEFLGSRL